MIEGLILREILDEHAAELNLLLGMAGRSCGKGDVMEELTWRSMSFNWSGHAGLGFSSRRYDR
jgi:hypothetical protein